MLVSYGDAPSAPKAKPKSSTIVHSDAVKPSVVESAVVIPAVIVEPLPVASFTSELSLVRASKADVPANTTLSNKRVRPSLSEQLAQIGAKADEITRDIKKNAGISVSAVSDSPLMSCPAAGFQVGSIRCRYPSPVSFFRDRCEYTFHHPFEPTEIRMIMYYRDMTDIRISGTGQPIVSFRIAKRLVCFAKDYDPSNSTHSVNIQLASQHSADEFRSKVKPLLMRR